MVPLHAYLKKCFGRCSGISFVDATSLKVCHNRRINKYKMLKDLAARGRTPVDRFFGFKLHLVVNDCGEILNAMVAPGYVDERQSIPTLLKNLFGKVFADRGYVSRKMSGQLYQDFGIQFFFKPHLNMKNKLIRLYDKLSSCKRSIIETIDH